LLLPGILPVFAVVAPCIRGAAALSVHGKFPGQDTSLRLR
jgi:hypothetical protein